MKLRLLALLATGLAGCGGAVAKDATGPSPADGYHAKADAACVAFLRFPLTATAGSSRETVLRRLDWYERAVRTAAPAEAPPDAEHRRLIHEPMERMTRRLRAYRAKIRGGAPMRAMPDDADREFWDFHQTRIDAAHDLGLERCVREQVRSDELDAKFRGPARDACRDAQDAFDRLGPLKSTDSIWKFEKARAVYTRLVEQLRRLTPPPRDRPLWEDAVAGAEAGDRALGALQEAIRTALGGDGEAALRQVERASRRYDAATARAKRSFRGLYFKECANLF